MARYLVMLALMAGFAVPAAAQAPDGWSVRVDRSTSATDPDDTPNLKVTTVGKGFQVTGGPAGTIMRMRRVVSSSAISAPGDAAAVTARPRAAPSTNARARAASRS